VMRDQIEGTLWQAVAHMHGMLGTAHPHPWSAGEAWHNSYAIKCMTHYELLIAGQPVFYWDFGENAFRVSTPVFASGA